MPVDFAGNPPASVTISDGSTDYLKIEAPDPSCRWNGFPVAITYDQLLTLPSTGGEVTTRQLSAFTTPIPAGGSPTNAEWPYLYMADPLDNIFAGHLLELDISFRSSGSGTARVSDQYNGLVWSANFSGNGAHGFNAQAVITPDCFQVGCPNEAVELITSWSPFNPLVPTTIGNGILTVRWTGGGTPTGATVKPCSDLFIDFIPPCGSPASTFPEDQPGLYICLGASECGEIDTTWGDIRTAINAHASGFTATVLGGHSADLAFPDPLCDLFPYRCGIDPTGTICYMDGAVCTGTVGSTPGG